MTKKHRIWAVTATVCVIFVMLFSAFYIAEELNHHCTGESCTICCNINLCEQTLKTLTAVSAVVCFSAAIICTYCILHAIFQKHEEHITLVSLKVKLSD
jgi:ABC-type proline/glycine betaine transport system permease subunit